MFGHQSSLSLVPIFARTCIFRFDLLKKLVTYSDSIIERKKKSSFKKAKKHKKKRRRRRRSSPLNQRRKQLESKLDQMIDKDLEEFRKIPKDQLQKFMATLLPEKLKEESHFEELQKNYINPVREMIQTSLESAGQLLNQIKPGTSTESSSSEEDEESTEDEEQKEEEEEEQQDNDSKTTLDIQETTKSVNGILSKQPNPSITISKTLCVSDQKISNNVSINLSEMNRMIKDMEKMTKIVDLNQKQMNKLPQKPSFLYVYCFADSCTSASAIAANVSAEACSLINGKYLAVSTTTNLVLGRDFFDLLGLAYANIV
ncbi:hypothetical protein DERP_000404 [Dermatophagoides pteronyssinus]|uniref:Uncharacterized protein n=1 Tax=Dermatophagoides pteronyssinus TaxID=6956 RepID=A0ABQ8J028_DERPT|nr:hypothetical protein DERP_000404 [Dermatophagoides pteronyssinus]